MQIWKLAKKVKPQNLAALHRSLNYAIVGFLGLVLVWVIVITALAYD